MGKKIYKRRKYILENSSQPKYIFSYFFLFFIELAFFSALFSLFSMETTTITYYDNIVNVGNTPAVLFKKLLGSILIVLLFGSTILFIFSVYITHKVAGPAYRIEKSLERMLSGDYNFKIILRNRDEMKPIANKLQMLSEQICQKNKKILQISREINNLVTEVNTDETIRKRIIAKCNDIITEINY